MMPNDSPPTIVPGQLPYLYWYPGVAFDAGLGAATFVDPQGLAMAYSASLVDGSALPSWISFDPSTGTFSGTVPTSYQNQVSTAVDVLLTATDTAGLSASDTYFIQIDKVLPPSESNFIPTVHVLPGHSFSSRMPADAFSDPQGLPMTYSASQGNGSALPSWLTFNAATLTFSGTAPTITYDNYTVQFHATDSAGQTGTVWFTIYFTSGPPNLSTPTADQSWTVGQPVNFTVPAGTFTDPQNQALTYSITGANGQSLPSWLQFNPHSLTFSGTPPTSSAGLSLGIQLTATDTGNLSTSETFNVVFAGQSAPQLSLPTPAQSWSPGQPLSWTLPGGTFTDPQGLALTYTAKSGNGSPLPSWLTFDPSTKTFSGTTPTTPASLALEVDATNSTGATTGDVFTATIGQPNAAALPPNLTDPTVGQYWTVGAQVSLTLAADTFTDPQNLPLTYSATQAGVTAPLPSWLTFNAATRSFTGIVPASGAELGIQVTATDSAGASASETFAALADQPSGSSTTQLLHSIPDSTWQIGQAIAIAVPAGTFSDPQGLALTYSATLTDGSVLPSWLTVSPSTGNISGIAPSTGQSISVRITATDSAGFTGHDDFLLNVPMPYSPELKDSTHDQSWAAGQSINLTLPSDSFQDPQGEALTYSAAESNGTALPSWLHFDAATRTFSGVVPSTATSLTITVTATDVSNLTDSETFAVTVSGTTPLPTIVETGLTAQQAVGPSVLGHVASVAVTDSAANVSANLDALQTLASAGILSSITLTDGATPTLALSAVQAGNDKQVVGAITGNYGVAVSDSAADVAANLASLQSLATSGKLASIALTDPGTPTLSISAAQLAADAPALAAISGNYTLSVAGVSPAVASFIVQQDGTTNYPGTAPYRDNSVIGYQSATFSGGIDSVVLSGARANYAIQIDAAGVTTIKDIGVGDATYGQTVTVSGESFIVFNPASSVASYQIPGGTSAVLDYPNDIYYVLTPANAQLAQFYNATLPWEPVPNIGGLEYWETQLAQGMSLQSIAQSFINTSYFQQTFGDPGTTHVQHLAFVELLYKNILGMTLGANEGGVLYWVGQMDNGMSGVSALLSFTNATASLAAVNATSGGSGWLIVPGVTGGYADPGVQMPAATVLSQAAANDFYNLSLIDPTTVTAAGVTANGVTVTPNTVTIGVTASSDTLILSSSFTQATIAGSGISLHDGPGTDSITVSGANNSITMDSATTDSLHLAFGSNSTVVGFSPGKGSLLAVSGTINGTAATLLNGATTPVHGASLAFGAAASSSPIFVSIGSIGDGGASSVAAAANAAYVVADVNGNAATGALGEHVMFLGTNSGGDAEIWAFRAPLSGVTVNGHAVQVPITGADLNGNHLVDANEVTLVATLIGVPATSLMAADLA